MYCRQYEILHVPMVCTCSVWCCGVLREFWLRRGGDVGRWLATISKKEKEKSLSGNAWGKG